MEIFLFERGYFDMLFFLLLAVILITFKVISLIDRLTTRNSNKPFMDMDTDPTPVIFESVT